jgi:outer membrane protein OmpA-like peptidoglycan-associated protein
LLCACSSFGRREQGAAIGAASGGVIGGIIGKNTGSTARGAIIGAVVGGVAGGVIGHQMDMQAMELRVDVPGATVERVGEGIQVTFASGLLYDFDSSEIRAEAGRNLGNLARSLAKYPNTNILIVGHTDATGTSEFNQQLSVRRAEAALSYLGGQGIASSRVRAIGRGEAEPVAPNDTEAGRQSNRRIEIAIYANAAAISNR